MHQRNDYYDNDPKYPSKPELYQWNYQRNLSVIDKTLPFGASNLQSHPFGGSPHLLKNSWPVVPAWPGLWLPETKPSIFNLHLPHLKLNSYINRKSNRSSIKSNIRTMKMVY